MTIAWPIDADHSDVLRLSGLLDVQCTQLRAPDAMDEDNGMLVVLGRTKETIA